MSDTTEQPDLFVSGLTKVTIKKAKKKRKRKKKAIFKQSDLFETKETSVKVDISPNT